MSDSATVTILRNVLQFGASSASIPFDSNHHLARVMPRHATPPAANTSGLPLESTADLLARVRSGDEDALNCLFERYLQPLTRWARGRLPTWARDLRETDDLVQDALTQTLKHVQHFQSRGSGSLFGYLRQAVLNRLRDEIRRVGDRRLESIDDHDHLRAAGPSPLEEVLGKDVLEAYDRSLDRLPQDDREAVVARIEMGASYAEIAELTGRPSADAARMAVSRALLKLAREIADGRG